MERKYYSIRTKPSKVNLIQLKDVFFSIFVIFKNQGYFQENFGIDCTNGFIYGRIGSEIDSYVIVRIRKNLWPIEDYINDYSEEDIFDIIEFVYDHISKPISGLMHSYNGCGWHYEKFDKNLGQNEFREEINKILSDYNEGFELSEIGEILSLIDPAFKELYKVEYGSEDDKIKNKFDRAISKFRRHKSSYDDKKDAVMELADILEYLKPKAQKIITKKDESDLFNIANNFGIRHHNNNQKIDYGIEYLNWIFYFYVATIHLILKTKN